MSRISIFTPTNDTSYLYHVWNSIKDQDFYEWVVVYNGGAQPIDFKDSRVKTFIIKDTVEHVGPLKAYACEKATGDILLELDHDDLLASIAIEEVKKAFEDPEIGFVYSNAVHANENWAKTEIYSEAYGWKYRTIGCNGMELNEHIAFPPTPDSLSRIWYAPNHLRSFRKSCYHQVGGYNKEMRVLDDFDLMCKLYQVTKFKHIDKGLYVYRIHGKNNWLKYNQEIQNNIPRLYLENIEALAERWADISGLKKIEVGGRMAAKVGFTTLDLVDADIIADLNKPWPFADSSVGVIRSFDVFEHLKDSIFTMKEVQRVLAPGGWLFCQVPSTDGRGAFQDPTHISFWNENSFWYYTRADKAKYIDTPVRFQAQYLETTAKNDEQVCWVRAHLVNLKDGYRPAGLIHI